MQTLAICSSKFKEKYKLETLELLGEKIYFSLIDYPDINDYKDLDENQVLIEIIAFSCNYRDKSLIIRMNEACEEKSESYIYSPFGSEFVGRVIDVGHSVSSLKKGDRVITDATYPIRDNKYVRPGIATNHASQRYHVFHEGHLIKIPDSLSDEKAASFTIAAQTVYSMLRRLSLNKGDRILITSATSNTSLAAISALKNKGYRLFALTTSLDYETQLLELGVEKVLPFDALKLERLEDYINFEKFEAVIDPFFDLHFCDVVSYMRHNSKYISCGLFNQHPLFKDTLNQNSESSYANALSTCIGRNISFIGNCLGNRDDLITALQDFDTGKFDIIIDSVFTGENYIPFLEKTFHKQKRFGKIIYKYI
ncbi:zinc-binding alcohol dehydrogenase family protein [Dysgonomonas sp. HDW5A]|uniref:quinone oxidoreductase family protein n=1 Tax=Dysgonomonas sp. HDW5A TaxID=2714926 RepID=UPI00140CA97D|nr:zinc-binding alcohol dehydrogenase family protein [Dysgonomonas sp. HDW5A]QIK61407.1 zinc-binding alcohol dehydrogenase family protein [Dysgonomonas sp. HDW5A]